MLEIPITITRRRTSRLSIRVTKDGEVRVSAPRLMPKRVIDEFVASHKEWIEKAVARVSSRQQGRETFYSRLDLSTPARRKEAATKLEAKVAPMIADHSVRMGVKPSGVSFRASKTRWGSCNTKSKHINLSLYLLLLPDWCIEHVVVHELAHLLIPNHSDRFYAVMDRHFPRWRDARRETRRLVRNLPGSTW